MRTPAEDYGALRLALPGRHQIDNAITAVRTLEAARACGLAPVDGAAVRLAVSDARWPGRLDWRRWQGLDVLVDGAHNPDGARALADFLRETVKLQLELFAVDTGRTVERQHQFNGNRYVVLRQGWRDRKGQCCKQPLHCGRSA